jgi:hypothetical protein
MNTEYYAYAYGILIYVIITISFFSFLSCLFVIYLYLKKKLRTDIMELLFYLAISETFNAITKFLSIEKLFYPSLSEGLKDRYSKVCYLQRFLGNYSDFATLLLITLISFCLYDMMIKHKKTYKNHSLLIKLMTFILPSLAAFM